MKYRPNCAKVECQSLSDIILTLPSWGYLYFCAGHALRNIQWQDVIEMKGE